MVGRLDGAPTATELRITVNNARFSMLQRAETTTSLAFLRYRSATESGPHLFAAQALTRESLMHVFSVVAHPRQNSFCHAISAAARSALASTGHTIEHHDLYAEGFDPCLTSVEAYTIGDTLEQTLARAAEPMVQRHRQGIGKAGGLLVVHPNWWGKPPAILAGWMDRILVPGVAYRLQAADGLPEGLLAAKTALIINTSDTIEEREVNDLGDPLELIWGRCVLPYCGVNDYKRLVFRPVNGSSNEARASWLEETVRQCQDSFGEGSE